MAEEIGQKNVLCGEIGKPGEPDPVIDVFCIYEFRAMYNCDYDGQPQQVIPNPQGGAGTVNVPKHGPWFHCKISIANATKADWDGLRSVKGTWLACDESNNKANCSPCASYEAYQQAVPGGFGQGTQFETRSRIDEGRRDRDFYAQYFHEVIHKVKTSELNAGWDCPDEPPQNSFPVQPTIAEWETMGMQCPVCYDLCPCLVTINGACGAPGGVVHHIPGGAFDPGGDSCTPGGTDYKMKICLPHKHKFQDTTKIIREEASGPWSRQRNFYSQFGSPFLSAGPRTWRCFTIKRAITPDDTYRYLSKQRGSWQTMEDCHDCAHDMVIMYQRCGEAPSVLSSTDSCAKGWDFVSKGKAFFRRLGTKSVPNARTFFKNLTNDGADSFTFVGLDGYCWIGNLILKPSVFVLNLTRWLNTSANRDARESGGAWSQPQFQQYPLYIGQVDLIRMSYGTNRTCCQLDLITDYRGLLGHDIGVGQRNGGTAGAGGNADPEYGGCKTGIIKCNAQEGKCCTGDGKCEDNVTRVDCENKPKIYGIDPTWGGGGSACGLDSDCIPIFTWLRIGQFFGWQKPKNNSACNQPTFPCCYQWNDPGTGVGKSWCAKKNVCDCLSGNNRPPAVPAGERGKIIGVGGIACAAALPCNVPGDAKGTCCDPICRSRGRCGGGSNVETFIAGRMKGLTVGGGCFNNLTKKECEQKAIADGGDFVAEAWTWELGKTCSLGFSQPGTYCMPAAQKCKDLWGMLPQGKDTPIYIYTFEYKYDDGTWRIVRMWDIAAEVNLDDVDDKLDGCDSDYIVLPQLSQDKFTRGGAKIGPDVCAKLTKVQTKLAGRPIKFESLGPNRCLLKDRMNFHTRRWYDGCGFCAATMGGEAAVKNDCNKTRTICGDKDPDE